MMRKMKMMAMMMMKLDSARLRATIFASRFAANALRGHKLRGSNSSGLKKLQKPPEPDFNEE